MPHISEVCSVFLRLGLFGFGGPLATMAMMEEEATRKRGWMSQERFSEIYAVCKVMPGPVSSQMAIYLGMERAGRLGGALAGILFVLPSFLLVLCFAIFYVRAESTHANSLIFPAMQAGALAVILLSTEQLSRPYRKNARALLIALLSAIVIWVKPEIEPLVILACGLLGAWLATRSDHGKPGAGGSPKTNASILGASALAGLAGAPSALAATGAFGASVLGELLWICFKAGAFVFGTGLAIVPLLEADFVQRLGWLSHNEFMDALAIGQVTPGPVVITVTFIGYKVAGLLGSIVATAGIFSFSFLNILFILPRIWRRISGKPGTKAFASWAMPAVIGGILGTSVRLASQTLTTPFLVILLILSLGASFRIKLPSWALIPACGALGALYQLLA